MDESQPQPDQTVDSDPPTQSSAQTGPAKEWPVDETSSFKNGEGDTKTAGNSPLQIGRYRVEKLLGAGAFGRVYLGSDEQLQRQVAIKVTHRVLASASQDAEAYLAEARMLAKLDHPHIVPVYDVGSTEEGRCFVVSKFIEGSDLHVRMQNQRMTHVETAEFVATVAEALHYAHTQGVVHRDIKPANLLIESNGKPVVADFGLALQEKDFGSGPRMAGTPAYMSPEQARGEGHLVDGRSDIFSLGAVFYQLLVGKHPFAGESSREMLERVIAVEVKPPRQRDDTVPKELERICLRALSKPMSERYTTAKDMAVEIRNYLAETSSDDAVPQTPHATPRRTQTNKLIFTLAVLTVAIAVALSCLPLLWNGAGKSHVQVDAPGSGQPHSTPIKVARFEILVSRNGGNFLPLDELAPLRDGDAVHFSIELSQPAHVRLIWIDAMGNPQELYPQDPEVGDRGSQPVLQMESPEVLDRGWPVEGQSGREIAMLLVSEKELDENPINTLGALATIATPKLTKDVTRYSAARNQKPQADTRSAKRSLGAESQQVDDAMMRILESMRQNSDVVHAVSIPHDNR